MIQPINVSLSAQKTYDGIKRSELKDSDFLFPEDRSYPIKTPADVKDAISNFGRGKHGLDFPAFIKKLYSKCKKLGKEFVNAIPESSLEKAGIKKKTAKADLALGAINTALADIGCVVTECCEEEEEVTKDDLENVYRTLYSYLDSFYSSINALSNRIYETQDIIYEKFWEHQKGHLPPINSVEQMTRAIDALGLSSEIEIQKKVIYASDGKAAKLVLEIPIK